ncbi:PucR family transcriptional regulator [Subtercola sp. YIM 133946]|uniref:PucR family transcriptional regulator n=1 Tax=Subtercola sp. YIM 133946 TaxID=3118909 RepID=UPI002F943D66
MEAPPDGLSNGVVLRSTAPTPGSPWPTLQALFSSLCGTVPDMSVRLAAALRSALPFYQPPSQVSSEELAASCRSHIDFLLDYRTGDGGMRVPFEIGSARARMGIPLPDVLDALRVGSRFLWDELVTYAHALQTVTDAELVELATEMWLMHDELVSRMEEGYRAEQAALLVTRERVRFSLIHTILTSSDQPTETLWEAVDRLGFPRRGGYVVVAAAIDRLGQVPLPDIERLLRARGVPSVWLLLADVQAGIVSTQRPDALDRLRAELEAARTEVGVSPQRADFSQAAPAFRLARTALIASPPGVTTFFGQSPLGVMAAGAPDIASQVSVDVLGDLLHIAQSDRDVLVETVQVWFDCGGSTRSAADRLFLHPNTVRNRLKRFETLTGRTLSNPREAAEVLLALAAHQQR